MSVTQYKDGEFEREVLEQIVEFARQTDLAKRHESFEEILDRLDMSAGMVENKENHIAIIFDIEQVPEKYNPIVESNTEADDVFEGENTVMGDETYSKFQFGEKNSGVLTKYINVIENVYDVNIYENPEMVLGSGTTNNWPIRVLDENLGTQIMVAPVLYA